MIDYLLKFNNKDEAETFAVNNGFAEINSDGITSQLYDQSYSISIIGEHYIPSGNEITSEDGILYPQLISDGFYWILFRDLADRPLPEGADIYVAWSSDMTVTIRKKTISVERPIDNPLIPNRFWA